MSAVQPAAARAQLARAACIIAVILVILAHVVGWGALAWVMSGNARGYAADVAFFAAFGTLVLNLAGIAAAAASLITGRGARSPWLALAALIFAVVGLGGTAGLVLLFAFAGAGVK